MGWRGTYGFGLCGGGFLVVGFSREMLILSWLPKNFGISIAKK
jgi:hypothetical protein